MPSLSIPFSEGEKVILLRGSHISVGRLPDNTIQIEDRTVSAYHFDLHYERDHYHLHDNGSTNGVLINGRRVQDFHLREESKILIGTVLCEFHPGTSMAARPDTVELLPVREEVQSTRRECQQLKNQLAILREQIDKMIAARGDGPVAGFDQLAEMNAQLRLQVSTHRDEIDHLASRLIVLSRDRDNLQHAYNDLHSALALARCDPANSRGQVVTMPAPILAAPAVESVGRMTVPLRRGKDFSPSTDAETEKLRP